MNEWNNLFNGLFTGGGLIARDIIQQNRLNEQHDQLSKAFNEFSDSLKQRMGQTQDQMTNLVNPQPQGDLIPKTAEGLNVNSPVGQVDSSTPNIAPVTSPPPDKNAVYQQLMKKSLDLSSKYGKNAEPYINAMDSLYKNFFATPEYDDKTIGNDVVRRDAKGNYIKVYNGEDKNKAKLDTNFAPDTVTEEDGKYYGINYILDENTQEPKTIKREIDKGAYDYFNGLETKKLETRSPLRSGRRSGRSGTGTIRESADDRAIKQLAKQLDNVNVSLGQEEEGSKKYEGLVAQRDRLQTMLQNKGIENPDDVANQFGQTDFDIKDYRNINDAVATYVGKDQLNLVDDVAYLSELAKAGDQEGFDNYKADLYNSVLGDTLYNSGLDGNVIDAIKNWFENKISNMKWNAYKEEPTTNVDQVAP
jgi:hypothetical protein